MKEIREIIEALEQEASSIQIQSRALTIEEIARLRAIYRAIPLLQQAADLFPVEEIENNLITYKIVSDLDGRLKTGARTACNFWNRFVIPRYSIVIRLGIFTSNSSVIARAYEPSMKDGVMYGVVEFNTKYLRNFDPNEIAGTIVHEIGHTLGFGWEEWMELFNTDTGLFLEHAIAQLGSLEDMHVETDYGRGTRFSHWDEERFDKELMTGFQDFGEHVLPVTIDVMELLGHQVAERLQDKTDLNQLLSTVARIQFTRQQEAKLLDLDYYRKTKIFEEIPHPHKKR